MGFDWIGLCTSSHLEGVGRRPFEYARTTRAPHGSVSGSPIRGAYTCMCHGAAGLFRESIIEKVKRLDMLIVFARRC